MLLNPFTNLLEKTDQAKTIMEAFNRYGKRLWRHPAEVSPPQIEVVDVDGSGRNKIVSAGYRLEVYDESGNKIESFETLAGYIGKFSLCTLPNKKTPSVLVIKDGYLWLIDFEGRILERFAAPLSDFPSTEPEASFGKFGTTVYESRGVWVNLVKDQPEHLVALARFAAPYTATILLTPLLASI